VETSGSGPWWESAIVYCLDVQTFDDSNGDGIGDFEGLRRRLGYLSDLGVTCLWLMPFYASPNRDDGYDITDHLAIDPRLGTLDDFDAFVRDSDERGLRVVVDLVVNHTSDEHPWFLEARQAPDSARGTFYVWSDEPLAEPEGVVFPDEVDGNWTYDDAAKRYFLHRYYPFQPDLDHGNPEVGKEMERIIAFWLDRGVSGFRVDSAPFVIEQAGWRRKLDDPHEIFRRWRAFAEVKGDEPLLVGEAYFPPAEQMPFFGDCDEFNALFHFHLNNALWLALARRSGEPLRRALTEVPKPPADCQWFTFLRSHDELTFEKLPDDDRDEVLRVLAPEPEAQIYGRGTRLRTASMLAHDPRRVRLALSLLLSLPGTPVLLYGDELGIEEDLSLEGRLSVRVPMRWSSGWNAGFSAAPEGRLVRPVRDPGRRGANVWDQARDSDSLLHWTQISLAARRAAGIEGGEATPLETGDDAVFAHRWAGRNGALVAAHNLDESPRDVVLGLAPGTEVTEIFADRRYDVLGVSQAFTLAPYGFRWFRVAPVSSDGAAVTGSRRRHARATR
jgi:maltose alpha-D-glucosyltransferase/alpha-amylase